MSDFFAMGGYGPYIWPAYIVSFVTLVAIGWGRYRRLITLRQIEKNNNKPTEQ